MDTRFAYKYRFCVCVGNTNFAFEKSLDAKLGCLAEDVPLNRNEADAYRRDSFVVKQKEIRRIARLYIYLRTTPHFAKLAAKAWRICVCICFSTDSI